MLQFLKRAIDSTDEGVNEKRLIAIYAFVASLVVILAEIVLIFLIVLQVVPVPLGSLQAIGMLLYLLMVVLVFILLMSGVIAWSDVNATAGIIRGIPGSVREVIKETTQTVEGGENGK
jgi:hypothetical protein